MPDPVPTAAGLTTREVAIRLRVSEDKIRAWLRSGELQGINTSSSVLGRPRWVILSSSLAAFERRRASGPAPRPARRPKKTGAVDFYSDEPGAAGGAR